MEVVGVGVVVEVVEVGVEVDMLLEMEEAQSSQCLAPAFASLSILLLLIRAENLRNNNVLTLESSKRCRAGPKTTSGFKSIHVLQL